MCVCMSIQMKTLTSHMQVGSYNTSPKNHILKENLIQGKEKLVSSCWLGAIQDTPKIT